MIYILRINEILLSVEALAQECFPELKAYRNLVHQGFQRPSFLTEVGKQTMEDGYRRADNLIEGTFTKATDGWVKISIPVYASVGTQKADLPLDQNFWLYTDENGDTKLTYGSVEVYLNIVGF